VNDRLWQQDSRAFEKRLNELYSKSKSKGNITFFLRRPVGANQDSEPKPFEKVLKDGSQYSGQWRGDVRHGQGILVSPQGWKYEGLFESDQAHGSGFLSTADGMSYRGQWRQGERHGHGTCTAPDGSVYEGQWRGHEKSGEGIEKYGVFKPSRPDGGGGSGRPGTYDGQFKGGLRDGEGTYSFSDGRRYVGQFMQGDMHGHGSMAFTDGAEYQGGFQRGQKHGMGSFRWADGRKYVGIWRMGHTDGKGVVVEPDGTERRADHQSVQSAFFIPEIDVGVREHPRAAASMTKKSSALVGHKMAL